MYKIALSAVFLIASMSYAQAMTEFYGKKNCRNMSKPQCLATPHCTWIQRGGRCGRKR